MSSHHVSPQKSIATIPYPPVRVSSHDCILDGGYIAPTSVPGDILNAVDHSSSTANSTQQDEEEEDGCTFFFGENPYSGMRVRQSGTMGNDLYVKNRWIVGGLFQQQQKQQEEGLRHFIFVIIVG